MAIAEDASAPANVQVGAQTVTTAAFSPVANSLIVALVMSNGFASSAMTTLVTDSGSHTWTMIKRSNAFDSAVQGGCAEVWVCYTVPSLSGITVTSAQQGAGVNNGMQLTTKVLTGANSTQNGATASTGGVAANPTLALTTTTTASRVYGAFIDTSDHNAFTANANTTFLSQWNDAGSFDTYASLKSAAATGTPGALTYGSTTNTCSFNMALVEILPAAAAAVPGPIRMNGQYNTFF